LLLLLLLCIQKHIQIHIPELQIPLPLSFSVSLITKYLLGQEDNSNALQELKEASFNMWRSTEELMGSLAMVASSLSGSISDSNNRSSSSDNKELMLQQTELYPQPQHTAAAAKAMDCEHHDDNEITAPVQDECQEDQDAQEREATRQMFETAESAVEAWAMLATSLGGQSFVKSEFQKICFVENKRTDTQVVDSSEPPLIPPPPLSLSPNPTRKSSHLNKWVLSRDTQVDS
jgi:hypothetical protein